MGGPAIDLSGQAAIVTGGGGGIGQGIALALARYGADVTVVDIEPTRAETTAKLSPSGACRWKWSMNPANSGSSR